MKQNIFFNSSVPRSCSTLLQNILGQNPDIHATPTDGCMELLYGAKNNFTNSPEFKAQDPDLMLKAWRSFCLGGIQGYCSGLTDKLNVSMKCRSIGIHYNWFSAFMGEDIKVLCMVRDLRRVFASMEKLYRKNPDKMNSVYKPGELKGTTVGKRVESWGNGSLVGLAVDRVNDIIQQGLDKKILFIRAEDLCQDPEHEMSRIYGYLNLPYYDCDYKNIKQVTFENDVIYGLDNNLHKIQPEIVPQDYSYREVLGEPTCRYINEVHYAYQKFFNYI